MGYRNFEENKGHSHFLVQNTLKKGSKFSIKTIKILSKNTGYCFACLNES